MKRIYIGIAGLIVLSAVFVGTGMAGLWEKGPQILQPVNGRLEIPLPSIDDSKAHHFRVQASDGTMVTFFTIRSDDGVYRAAIDACDVCYKSGKGYEQNGVYMICRNCGQSFHASKINVIKGGCNPAPLERMVEGDKLVIAMADIDKNSWYGKYTK
ncbi:MAG: DUF2318 domain-containing protein [Desulfobulbaceae bacterium]|nr:DUF2318 domain-containing protein [Desulfobulbaceae bacterium]HIJ78987.1 DUF2318 domain-containing protein [Deltaproteobacteria bacterium]